MQHLHHACPITVLLCTAAAVRVPGTIPSEVGSVTDEDVVRVPHPKGVSDAAVRLGGPRGVQSVSVTDHVIEPPHRWQTWLPPKFRDRAPRVARRGVAGIRIVGPGPKYETDF